jgi:hypothetical protein
MSYTRLNSTSSSYDQKKKGTFDLKVSRKIKTPTIHQSEVNGQVKVQKSDSIKPKIQILESAEIPRATIQRTSSTSKLSLTSTDAKVDIGLK